MKDDDGAIDVSLELPDPEPAANYVGLRLWPWQRWWRAWTHEPGLFPEDDEVRLFRTTVTLNPLGRLLVLFGRDVQIEVCTGASQAAADSVAEHLTVQGRHVPRRFR